MTDQLSNGTQRRARRITAAAAGLVALAIVLGGPVATADEVPEGFRGKNQITIKGKRSEKVTVAVTIDDAGAFVVGVGSEIWTGIIVGGRDGNAIALDPGVTDTIAERTSSDAARLFESKLVSKQDRTLLKVLRRDRDTLVGTRLELQARYDDLQTRIANLLSGGGIILPDILQGLRDESAVAQALLDASQEDVANAESALRSQEQRTSPSLETTVDTMRLTFRTNRKRTRVKVKARIDCIIRNLRDGATYTAKRKVSGRGRLGTPK